MSQEAPGQEAAQAVEDEDSATSPGEVEETEESGTETKDPAEKPRKQTAAERIAELTAYRRSAEQERDYWRQQAQQKEPPKPEPQAEAKPDVPPPTLESVDYDQEKYEKAMDEWVNARVEKAFVEREQKTQAQRREEENAERRAAFIERGEKYAEKFPDYHEVVRNPALPITEGMAEVIQISEQGPEVLYHLGKNPDVAAKIARMSQTQAALELGRIEAKLGFPQPKKQTNAPAPINTLSGNGETAHKDPDQMDTKQWLKWREEQLASK